MGSRSLLNTLYMVIKRAIGYGPDNAYTKKNLVNFIAGAEEAANAAMDVADMTNVGVTAADDTTFPGNSEHSLPVL